MERKTLACGNVKLWMSWSNKSWILLWKTNLKSNKDWEKINRQTCDTICLCLAKNVNFGGDMVIKPLHKFKCCLDLYGICNLN